MRLKLDGHLGDETVAEVSALVERFEGCCDGERNIVILLALQALFVDRNAEAIELGVTDVPLLLESTKLSLQGTLEMRAAARNEGGDDVN